MVRWKKREKLDIVLRSRDAKGKIHKRHLKLDKKYDLLIPYFLEILGLGRDDLKAFLKERVMDVLARMSNAWDAIEREFNMSSKEIIERCKKDAAFLEKARKILNDALDDKDEA